MIRIYGNSDDQVYVERDGVREQCEAYEKDLSFLIGDSKEGGLMATISYGRGCSIAVWGFDIAQIDEGIKVPWPVRIENARETDHSLALVVECPPGTPLERMTNDHDENDL